MSLKRSHIYRILTIGIIIIGAFVQVGWSQQHFVSSLTQFDKYGVNPGYGGMDDKLSLAGSYRSQWQGIDGHPEFMRLSGHLPLYNINGASGFNLRKEDIGAESNISLLFSYNQVFRLDFGLISLGTRAGWLLKSLDGEALISAEGNYEGGQIEHNDPFLPNIRVRGSAPSWGVGLYFFSEKFDCGIVFDDSPVVAVSLDGISIQKRHLILLHGNYFLNLSNVYRLELFGLMRSDFTQWQTEFGLVAKWNNRLYTSFQIRGYSERSFDAVSIGIGGRLNKQLQLSYSYDITLSPLRQVSNGAHELLLRYLVDVGFGKKIPEKIIHNPRLYD